MENNVPIFPFIYINLKGILDSLNDPQFTVGSDTIVGTQSEPEYAINPGSNRRV